MKSFLRRLFLFSSCLLLVATLMQALISYRIKDKVLFGSDNLNHTSHLDADLVLMGSSRCWAQLDPRFFDTVFQVKSVNIGVNGHSEIPMMVLRLKNYLSKNKPPKFAILNFDPFVNAGNSTEENNVLKNEYARFSFFPDQKNVPILDYFKFTTAERYVPLYSVFKYRIVKSCLFPKSDNNYLKYGYENNDEHWDTIARPPITVMKKYFFTKNDVPAITKSLMQLRKLCSDNGIRLLCIQTPVYKIIYNEANFSQSAIVCKNLNIPFVDANAEFLRNDINNFYNSNHLNRNGVVRMNGVLKDDQILHGFFIGNR